MCKIFTLIIWGENGERDVFCTVMIYYAFDKDNKEESVEYFSIAAGTPLGIANYLSARFSEGTMDKIAFFSHLVVVEVYDQEKLLDYIKGKVEAVVGGTREEVTLKLIRGFDWEYEANSDVMRGLYGGVGR